MKKLFLSAILLFAVASLSAQDYDWAVGVRGGGMASGLTLKHKVSSRNAWEATFNTWYSSNSGSGFIATGLKEWCQPVIDEGFNLYYGFGGHLGSAKFESGDDTQFALGVDGVVGLEYKIPDVPIAFSLDYRPFFNLVSKAYVGSYDFGLGVKFCF